MKKIIITILVALFSCTIPIVNKNNDVNTSNTSQANPIQKPICNEFNIENLNEYTISSFFRQLLKEPKKNYISPDITLILDTGYFLESYVSLAGKNKVIDFSNLNFDFIKDFSDLDGDYDYDKINKFSGIDFFDSYITEYGEKKDSKYRLQFMNNKFEVVFKNECDLNKFLEIYKIKKYEKRIGDKGYPDEYEYFEIFIDDEILNKANIKEIKNYLKKYNSFAEKSEGITKVRFSSVRAVKLLTFLMEVYFNNKELFKNIGVISPGADLNFIAEEKLLSKRK
ncbi:MAG: hypothetical protein AABZ74_17240 [Cyanobacteriota bacterium]